MQTVFEYDYDTGRIFPHRLEDGELTYLNAEENILLNATFVQSEGVYRWNDTGYVVPPVIISMANLGEKMINEHRLASSAEVDRFIASIPRINCGYYPSI